MHCNGKINEVLTHLVKIMEAFEGFDSKFEYSIIGHSGDSPHIPFTQFGQPPKSTLQICSCLRFLAIKDKLKVLKSMSKHSQYCSTGDLTIEAIKAAVLDYM